jgi:hypothetical protein
MMNLLSFHTYLLLGTHIAGNQLANPSTAHVLSNNSPFSVSTLYILFVSAVMFSWMNAVRSVHWSGQEHNEWKEIKNCTIAPDALLDAVAKHA